MGESPHSAEASDQPAPPPHTPASAPRRRSATPTVKTNLSLPPAAAERLRGWSDATGRSLADGIITALINSGDELEQQCAGEARRVQLGLPAITADNDTAESAVVTIRVPGLALEELDNTAARLGLPRRAEIEPRPAEPADPDDEALGLRTTGDVAHRPSLAGIEHLVDPSLSPPRRRPQSATSGGGENPAP